MAQTFKIAQTSKIDDYNLIRDKQKVSKELFYETLNSKVKEVVEKQPERFEEILVQVKIHLEKNRSLTIRDTWFEIKGKA